MRRERQLRQLRQMQDNHINEKRNEIIPGLQYLKDMVHSRPNGHSNKNSIHWSTFCRISFCLSSHWHISLADIDGDVRQWTGIVRIWLFVHLSTVSIIEFIQYLIVLDNKIKGSHNVFKMNPCFYSSEYLHVYLYM